MVVDPFQASWADRIESMEWDIADALHSRSTMVDRLAEMQLVACCMLLDRPDIDHLRRQACRPCSK
jgi:hypothetical protein